MGEHTFGEAGTSFSRRELIATSMSAGFALAVLPIASWAVTTPSDGLTAGPVSIPAKGGSMPAYRAMPSGKGKFPAIVVVPEIFGIHAYIQDVCRRLAKQGYAAVAPDLFFRQGDPTKLTSIDEIRSKVISKVPQAQVMDDMDATVSWLEHSGSADPAKVGVTGFCWGGNVTWMYASHNPKLKAAAAWYGRLVGDPTPLQPSNPLDIAEGLKVPVLGLYGGKDKGIPLDSIEKTRSVLKKGKSGSEIVVYPDAEHGFHADYRPSYHEKSAKEAWGKMLDWFKKHGLG